MAQELLPVVAIIGGLSTGIALVTTGSGQLLAWAVGVAVAVVVFVAWWFSPLPNRTVMGGLGDPEAGYWGFRRGEEGSVDD